MNLALWSRRASGSLSHLGVHSFISISFKWPVFLITTYSSPYDHLEVVATSSVTIGIVSDFNVMSLRSLTIQIDLGAVMHLILNHYNKTNHIIFLVTPSK